MPFLIQLIIAVLLIFFSATFIFWWLKIRRQRVLDKLHLQLFSIRLPRRGDQETSALQEISKSEQLFSALGSVKKPIIFEAAVPYIGEEIKFFAAVPKEISEPFVRQIHSIWNGAIVERVGDYNIFNQAGATVGGWVKQRKSFVYPTRTYKDLESDTFQSILGGLTKIDEVGEGGAIQLILVPSTSKQKGEMKSALKTLRKGKAYPETKNIFSETMQIISGTSKEQDTKNSEERQVDQAAVQATEAKSKKPLFRANLRIFASANTEAQAGLIFDSLTTGFSQLELPGQNSFRIVKTRNVNKSAHQFAFREFDNNQEIVLNTEELASIFHFPTKSMELPRLESLKSRQLPPPSDLPRSGILLGESVYRGEKKSVFITDDDRRRHFYIIGQTGTGKSNLIVSMAEQDIRSGKGLCVIDPHGDLIDDLLGLVPRDRFDDVILFDPSYLQKPLGLNMLEYDPSRPEEKTFIVNELVQIFDRLYDLKATGGPMFEQYMRNALLLLMEDTTSLIDGGPATLMEVPRIFTDSTFRKKKLARISNPTVIDFWEKEAERAGGEASLSNITPYVTSKFNNFTANDYMRVIVGQSKSAFQFRRVMDEGRILLVNLSKGKIGELNANLLGMIIVGKLLIAALSRAEIGQEQRKDFNLFIDEFQNFTTDSIATILSEARKYRLNLNIAHQFIAQLTDSIRDAVFGNVGSVMAFRVGAPDAEVLVKQFEPHLTAEDLVNVSNFHAYLHLLIRGEVNDPFNIRTLRAPVSDNSVSDEIKQLVRERYGKSREEVEKEILRRLRE